MTTTSSVDDYAAIAARLNEIEGKTVYDPMTDRMVERERGDYGRRYREEFERAFTKQAAQNVLGVKVMCTQCMDTGWVRRVGRSPIPGAYQETEETCPHCGNPQGRPPP